MKIAIGNDHAGPEYKKAIVDMLKAKGYEVTNYGTDSNDSVDYPDFGHAVALCWMKEIAALARQHNDANIISIPARYTSIPQAVEMVNTFLNTEFEGGRHQTRVDKIACC